MAPPVDSYGSLSVHKAAEREAGGEGGTLRFPDFSQPSPLSGCLPLHGRQRAEPTTTTTCAVLASIPHTFPTVSVVPEPRRPRPGEHSDTERVCGRGGGGVFFRPHMFSRTTGSPATIRRRASSLPQAGLGSVVCRRRRPRPASRPGSSVWGTHKKPRRLVVARCSFTGRPYGRR